MNNVQGQDYNLANTFTVNEGLPSNHIYDVTQDNKDFLWIATDNGIAHFDGKYFYNYTVKDGLPSNDVLQVVKEKDGTIWVNCYKQNPAYFDEINNKFVAITNNKAVNKLSNSLLYIQVLPDGGVSFYCKDGFVNFNKRKVALVGNETSYGKILINNKYYLLTTSAKGQVLKEGIVSEKYHLQLGNKRISSFIIEEKIKSIRRVVHKNSYFKFQDNASLVRYSKFKLQPPSFTIDSINLPERIRWYTFTKDKINIIANSGTIYMYDLEKLKLLNKVENKIPANVAYLDNKNNLWVGTTDKGLLYYNLSKIKRIDFPNDVGQDNFLSIAINNKKEIFTGNYLSQIFKSTKRKQQAFTISSDNKTMWIRGIMTAHDKIVVIHDQGYSINYQKSKDVFCKNNGLPLSIKSAIKLNDSISILATTSSLCKMNMLTEKFTLLNSPKNRILNLAKKNDSLVYFVSNQSIYNYNYNKNQYHKLPLDKIFTNNNPSVIATSDNNLLWIATFKGQIVVVQNDKLLHSIKIEEGLPENVTNIIALKDEIWIASKSGICVIKYKLAHNKLLYTINKLTKSDGLTSNVVNQLVSSNDTIYAATNAGVSIIPSQIKFNKFEINPTVIAVTIKNKKVPIATVYDLNEDQSDVSIQFAGVELSGHFKNFQYSLNKKNNWINLDGTTLNLSLNKGTNLLYVRAIDVNNNISSKIIKLKFDVDFPIYKNNWFWFMIMGYVLVIALYIIYRRRLAKQKSLLKQQLALEQQRNKITADLHDDIGATLSSLQINSAVANRLMTKNPQEAQLILEKIENQSQNIADKIGDIIWSMKPGKDEFMTISTRIKNFANDILGATSIAYEVIINPLLDVQIKDISTRKNIILITKEAINNTVKYSQATTILITLSIEQNAIALQIKDNGIGFDTSQVKGNGMANMRKRVEELNGEFSINSSTNKGTTIKAVIPFIP